MSQNKLRATFEFKMTQQGAPSVHKNLEVFKTGKKLAKFGKSKKIPSQKNT